MATHSKAEWSGEPLTSPTCHLPRAPYVYPRESRGPTCDLQECALLGLVGTFLPS